MKREAYEIHLSVVDANGTITVDPTGYPKTVDSRSYDNDLERTMNRARGLLGAAESSMSTQDTRQVQYAYIVRVSDGMQIDKRVFGNIAELPDPETEE